ncbi:response regulator [Aliamphritea spongicola]|nr:response regulator [Aliamphritea spongicola]
MQVLIVEDDAELAAAIADYLSLFEVECDFAYSGSAGLEMARHGSFDIIILDLMLPKMNGFSVARPCGIRATASRY